MKIDTLFPKHCLAIIILALIVRANPSFAQIPQISLTGDFCETYTPGRMTIVSERGDTAHFAVMARWRGSSALSYAKKSFAVKLIDDKGADIDTTLLGMREDNSWILDAMAVDKARMRNRVSFDLWNDFAADTYVKKVYKKQSFNGTHGRFVELTLNGAYNGLYCFTEKIDRKQLKLKKIDKAGTVRGVLYKATGYAGTNFESYEDYDNHSPVWMSWESKYPDVVDDGITDYAPLYEATRFVVEAPSAEFCAHVDEVFDLPVWTDYFLFINVIYAIDNCGKNTYTYVYDETKTRKIGIAPWDLDATWGRSYDGTETATDKAFFVHMLNKRLIDEYPHYMEQMAARYFALRQTFFEASALKNRFATYYQQLRDCGAIAREEARWQSVDGIALNVSDEMDYISSYIDAHLAFEDQLWSDYATGIYTLATDCTPADDAYYNLGGQRINGKPTRPGLYLHGHEKVLIR